MRKFLSNVHKIGEVHICNVWKIIMQSLNIMKSTALELQIMQTKHRRNMSSSAPLKK